MPFGATIIDADGLRLTPEEKKLFREADPFGFILFARNIDTPEQVHALCSEMRDAVGREARMLRDRAGIIDISNFAKYVVRGPGARDWLEAVFANRIGARRETWAAPFGPSNFVPDCRLLSAMDCKPVRHNVHS